MVATIGKYQIVEELGRGGMGVVYKAWDEGLQRHVAIKVLANPISKDATVAARFLREARAVADLNHPNLVQVFDVDTHQDQPYFVMEYLDGESLAHAIESEGRLSVQRCVRILADAAQGLAAVHEKGVVHRDIKPANIMLMAGGGVKVVDFGIARVEDAGNSLTGTGMALGTPSYLSPEVCLAEEVDQRSDIFALGVVFFEMLTGEVPFRGDSPLEQMTQVVECKVPDIKALNPNVDEGIRVILAHMVAREPAQRYSDCASLGADLQRYLSGQSPRTAAAAASAVGARDTRPIAAANSEGGSVGARSGAVERYADPGLLDITLPQTSPLVQRSGTLSVIDAPAGRKSSVPMLAAFAGVLALAAGSWWYLAEHGVGMGSTQVTQGSSGIDQTPAVPAGEAVAIEDNSISAGSTPPDANVVTPSPPVSEAASTAPAAHDAEAMQGGRQAGPVVVAVAALAQLDPGVQAATQGVAQGAGEALSTAPAATMTRPAEVEESGFTAAGVRGNPRILVAGFGDPAIAGPLEDYLEARLTPDGYGLVDEDFLADGELFSGPRPGPPIRMTRAATQAGADVAILFEVMPVGEQDLHYYGRSTALRTATLKLRMVALRERRPLGAALRDEVHYVGLNATAKAEALGARIAPRVLERLRRFSRATKR